MKIKLIAIIIYVFLLTPVMAPAKKGFSDLTIPELTEEVKKFKDYPSILIHLYAQRGIKPLINLSNTYSRAGK